MSILNICWWNSNAAAIQAICAALGVAGLAVYCWLTHHIRQATVAQQRAAQAPFLMLYQDASKWDANRKSWTLKNYGVGPAVEIWWKPGHANAASSSWYHLGALGAGDVTDLPHSSRPEEAELLEMPEDGILLHYADSAGNHYSTEGFFRDDSFFQDWKLIDKKSRIELRHIK